MFKFDIIFIKRIENLIFDKIIAYQNKGWQFEEVSWKDMFEGGEVLMSGVIGSLSVTLFSFNWSLEMGKYDVMH